MVVHTDADLGVMRFLTLNLLDQPDVELVLILPGPPAYDDATAAEIRELVAKGCGRRRDLPDRRLSRDLREPTRRRRRVHARADGALLRHRLRAARPIREPDPLHPAARGTNRRAVGRGAPGEGASVIAFAAIGSRHEPTERCPARTRSLADFSPTAAGRPERERHAAAGWHSHRSASRRVAQGRL